MRIFARDAYFFHPRYIKTTHLHVFFVQLQHYKVFSSSYIANALCVKLLHPQQRISTMSMAMAGSSYRPAVSCKTQHPYKSLGAIIFTTATITSTHYCKSTIMDDDHDLSMYDDGWESAPEAASEYSTPVGEGPPEEWPAQRDSIPTSRNDTEESRVSDSSSETEDPAATTAAAVPVVTVDPPSQSPTTASPTLTWEDARNFGAGAFDDDDADAAFNAVIRRQTLPPQTVEQIEAEEARGFFYNQRPRSPVFGYPKSDEVYIQSNRVYQGEEIGTFEARVSTRYRRDESRPSSPLRKVSSTEELSPEQSPTEAERQSTPEATELAHASTEHELAVEASSDDDDKEFFQELFGSGEGDPESSPGSHPQTATDEAHAVKGTLRVSTDIDNTRKAPSEVPGDDLDNTDPDDDSKSPTSAEELEMLTKTSINDGIQGLRNAYHALAQRSLDDHAKTLRLKRQMLAFYTKHKKLNVLDDDLLEEACELGAKAAAHLYRSQRDEFRGERDEARDEVISLVDERDKLVKELRWMETQGEDANERQHQLAKAEKDLKHEKEKSMAWKAAYEKLHPLAMVEIQRRERREDSCSVATQTEEGQAVSNVATQREAEERDTSTATVPGSGASPRPVAQASQARVEAPSALPSWNTTVDLVGTVASGPDISTFIGKHSYGAQTNERWRAREEEIQNTAGWKRNYAAILQRLQAGGIGSASAIEVR
ncbi:hypothetical protein BDY17DRAFT_140683 [Neohortaea acidophila]|uniref:Uncharacterized protein n=1 Tax=Neohortaea acidophila TaxID=245834 RepID=A0A6A6PSJ2_9PEZI|nr:uncharacterized protein BDY17DRAFT_140683 [Neohortaea acidophila]KAF2483070.1 hypothetical protein BDY17DRAFT_140683 [Neohortaea acidophila]